MKFRKIKVDDNEKTLFDRYYGFDRDQPGNAWMLDDPFQQSTTMNHQHQLHRQNHGLGTLGKIGMIAVLSEEMEQRRFEGMSKEELIEDRLTAKTEILEAKMNGSIDQLTTEALQAELERRRFEGMSKEELIEELERSRREGDWPEKTRKNLLELAAAAGYDVNTALGVNYIGLKILVGSFYALASFVVFLSLDLMTDSKEAKPLFWVVLWPIALAVAWFARKIWVTHRGIYDGRNEIRPGKP
ncbi:MAG: hypothetical protein A2527_12375 [Candidatus Lambdaproteobacteria bacterium RIFOXYD2_FULL_50_16]|uniref:Uncharacterized protein n=1 Tax=Candidatus Lambdaproteobacteria bacterium RIFOXYD2_FULL_50_16 TaxID=1817772 RepID=A0A1F6GDC3_9PROT|nr:MAG: hypothetical protein A2527_12375 [Candidatus Lambdaproteobacteria bacterium RIFOXYD2_FULL_50_16]